MGAVAALALLWGLLSPFLCSPIHAKVTSFQPDDTAQCLADPTRLCDSSRSCSFRTYHPACLAAPVPYASLDHARVSCCLKCCHYHFAHFNKLNTNQTAFEENQMYLPNYNLQSLGHNDNLLLSNSLLYQMSHAIKIDSYNSQTMSSILSYPSYKITTFKDFNATIFDYESRNTKRAIFVNLENECVHKTTLGMVASQLSNQRVPLISMLFTKHLPCPMSPEAASVPVSGDRKKQRQLRLSATGTGKSKMRMPYKSSRSAPRPPSPPGPGHRPRQGSRPLQRVLTLLPYGVRSTLAASQVQTSGVTKDAHSRPRLLDCSCARQYTSGQELIRGNAELQQLCNRQEFPDILMEDIDEFNYTQMVGLKNYYQSLTSVKFVLSPADGGTQSYCEWEALAFGAIPVMKSEGVMRNEISTLFLGLPIHVVESFKHMDEHILSQLHTTFGEQLKSAMSKYSFEKLYHPYWLNLMKSHFTYGKPAQRPWPQVDIAFKKMKLETCAFERKKSDKLEQNKGADPYASKGGASTNPYFAGANPPVKIQLTLPSNLKKSKLTKAQPLRRVLSTWNGSASTFDSDRETKTIPIRVLSKATTGEVSVNPNADLIELVLPRCCESGLYELEWLSQLLSVTEQGALSVSIYYKCLECLPASLAYKWLGQKGTMMESDYNRKHNFTSGSKRITLLDDSALVAFGVERVKQYPLFDRIHNGKEVTAYLQYILDRHNSLPKQVVFLHTSPHAHLHLPLLTKFLKYFINCDSKGIRPVDFMHLNVHYKAGGWGACCGKKGLCRESTWNYLFSEYPEMGSDYEKASTYSSAQFVASRGALQRWPVSFWRKMLMAINGEHDLEGCPHSSDPNGAPSWGGHQLTGQYERMWHIIFGQKAKQVTRRKDHTLPYILRMDCENEECRSGAL